MFRLISFRLSSMRVGRHIVDENIITGQGADMRDAAAHLPRADHTDRSDIRHIHSPRA